MMGCPKSSFPIVFVESRLQKSSKLILLRFPILDFSDGILLCNPFFNDSIAQSMLNIVCKGNIFLALSVSPSSLINNQHLVISFFCVKCDAPAFNFFHAALQQLNEKGITQIVCDAQINLQKVQKCVHLFLCLCLCLCIKVLLNCLMRFKLNF